MQRPGGAGPAIDAAWGTWVRIVMPMGRWFAGVCDSGTSWPRPNILT